MTQQQRSGTGWLLPAGLLLLILAAVAGWWASRQQVPVAPPAGPPPAAVTSPLSAAETSDIIRQKNVGLAQLENQSLQDAMQLFEQLAIRLPDEQLPSRNLAIAAVMKGQTADPADAAAFQTAVTRAKQALAAATQREGDSLALQVLAARLAERQQNTSEAVKHLSQARQLDASDLLTAFELYTEGSRSEDLQTQALARSALDDAFRLSPTNLVILIERLQAQAKEQDPAIRETLTAGMPRWQQLADGLKQRVRVDLLEMVAATQAAVDAGNWPLVTRNVLMMRNIINPEEASQSDRRRVERHPLEFVIDEFSPEFTAAARSSDNDQPVVPLVLADNTTSAVLPEMTDIVVAGSGDVDLDGVSDLCLLRSDSFQVLSRQDGSWSNLVSLALAESWDNFLMIDLDDDIDTSVVGAASEESEHPQCHLADLDLVLYGPSGVHVFKNELVSDAADGEKQRTFTPVELPEPLDGLKSVRHVVAADIDADGDLDLLCVAAGTLQAWKNRGNWTFDQFTTIPVPEEVSVQTVLPLDWDQDLDIDLLLGSEAGGLSMLENLRHGEFQWGEVVQVFENSSPVNTIEPFDHNGSWDLLLAGPAGLLRLNTRTSVPGTVTTEALSLVSDETCEGLVTGDLNNDGWLDAIGWEADSLHVYRGGRDASLSLFSGAVPAGLTPGGIRSLRLGDVVGEGQEEVLLAEAGKVRLLSCEGDAGQSWLEIRLLAAQIKGSELSASGRVNHYGLGSVLDLRDGLHRQRRVVRQPVTHFGLGTSTQADVVRVLWTNGVPENIIHPLARTFICERQSLKGSCPYLYTWDGKRMAFVTDLLWASPIGMVGAGGMIVPDRPWEHLKIDGRLLQPREGRYELRITEELWEAAYFDKVELFAVDHPGDTEVFTNEKVGPPDIAAHRLHTVRRRRIPISAVDQQGRDVLSLIAQEDDRYARLFDTKLTQGYTEDTFLELDLGPLEAPRKITLFLTGWIYPTDTTISVALSQNPDLPGPRPPALWIPDAFGQWQEVRPFMGFPGGKTKTIAVDLSGLFSTDDYRLRIATSNEIYWDAVFFTIDEEPVDIREIPLQLTRADLRTRGVSRPIEHPQFGPERYDYDSATPSQWSPMDGRFTRLGDVRELLLDEDARLVVMGSGDEVALEFAVPDDPVPPGWTRDFVLRNVGWDKDADLQTIYGQTVEPLPFVGMSQYPPGPEAAPPDPEGYQVYLDHFQTRVMWPLAP